MFNKSSKKSLALVLGLGVVSGVAVADETAKADDSIALDEVVVTAQKREQNLQETPIAISSYDAQAIEDQGVHDISDISSTSPNVQIAPSPGGSTGATVAIRGSSMINPAITWEPAAGIFIDGVFVAKNMGGLFDVAELERIEVLRGPQGTLYGKNTTGGAINLVTRKPAEEFGGNVKLGSGNFGYSEVAYSVDTGKLGDVASFNVAINKRDRDGFYDNDSAAINSADEFKQLDSVAARIAGLFEVTDKLDVFYTYDMSDKNNTPAFGQLEFPTSFVDPELPGPDRADEGNLDGSEYEDSESSGHAVTVIFDISETLELKSITAYREMQFDDANDYDGTPVLGFHTERHIEQEQLSQEFQLLGQVGIVNYVAGLYYFDDQADTINPFIVPTPLPLVIPHEYGVDSTSNALFGQADIAATDAWTITVGGRYTTESKDAYLSAPFAGINVKPEESWNNFSPMMAVNVAITDTLNTYAKVSRGWKAGGFNAEAGTTADAIKPYDEETLTAYEIGIKSRWVDDRIQANIALFHNNVDDLQVSAWDAMISASRVSNAGEAEISGIEIETLFAIIDGLTAFLNYGYLDTQYLDFIDPVSSAQLKDTAQFAYTPENKYAIGMDYLLDMGFAAFHARLDYAYTDSQYFYYDAYSAAVTASEDYALLNARVGLTEIGLGKNNALEVALWGKNLTDEQYRLNGIPTATGGAVNYYGDPRTFGIEGFFHF